jgi:SAM-dependent methyltransferase
VLFEDRRRAGSFGDDAEQYDRARPTYPDELVTDVVAGGVHDVVDVGCGTGIAARLLMARGCEVVGVEPDERMAALARRSGVRVESGTFEAWNPQGRTFDAVVSGQAWHWVDPSAGVAKAAEVLRPSGRIALFWNQGHQQPDVKAALDAVYDRLAPDLDAHSILLHPFGTERFDAAAASLGASGLFTGPKVATYHREQGYSRDQWLDHLPTHSDHRTLAPEQLQELLRQVGEIIDGFGGEITVRYETWLVTAHRSG